MKLKNCCMPVLFLASLFCAAPLFAGRADVGTSGAVFLKIAPGARPSGLGEAFGGVANDVNSIFYNPAGASRVRQPEFMAQYGVWFQSINYNVLGFVYPTETAGSFGLGIISLSMADIEKRTSDTEDPDGKFGASDFAYILCYARSVLSNLSAGVNFKLISQKIDTQSATAYAADAGVLWDTPLKNLSAGLSVQNAGTAIKFVSEEDPLPLNIKGGFGYIWQVTKKSELTGAFDINYPRDNDIMYNIGAEYRQVFPAEIAGSVRAGYKTVTQEKLGGNSGLTAGAGISWRQFNVDFAWVPYGLLGDTFRYSLNVKF
ncbi:MAG TPA: hypothetical protein DEE98_04000 [Elusimicrobia bacterium]|nr:MAG: hypothetical protein A2278_07010 [Elusimicrobia bacterium RIFOXYA12_FULL_49_49]OGS16212.1 MAG: hypothetical protein A2251_01175 [Elusimicrobia bacterium RIFOXYA2_FULL_47_53]OGS31367.1 MAG: hypothetical protein A2323_09465 [Elusimicrobia bacterium RIFOXYB2_FULL_46_23]HBU69529.1 hypothetical protein [Elusimicrobiota bacterium]